MKDILKNYSILYAEDDKGVQKATADYIQRYFKEVYVASDGKEAWALYLKHKPDVLLSDIDMPHMDGLALAHKIREINANIPIVMITAFTDTGKLLKATELNLTKYLVKPVDPMAFKEALQKLSKTLALRDEKFFHLKEGYVWDNELQELSLDDRVIPLLQKEKVLLQLLVKKHRECVNFTDIMALVWEDDFDAEISVESVKFQVTQLRKKLPKESIKNVYGKGYILE